MALSEAAKEARRIYKNKWNREHKDRVKAHQERYWERKAQEMKKEGGKHE